MAEEVVTRFTLDTSEFDAKVEGAASDMDGYSKASADAAKSNQNLGASMGSAATKMTAATKATKEQSKSLTDLKKQIDTITKNKATLTDPKKIAEANTQIAKLTAQYKSLDKAQAGVSGGLGKLTSGLKGNLQQVVSGFGGAASSAAAFLGPVGISVAALGAGLFKAFENLDSGKTFLEGVGRTGGIVFDKLTGTVKGFFEVFTEGNGPIATVFNGLVDAIDFVTQPIQDLLGLIGEVTGVSEAFAEAAREGQELAEAYDAIDEKQRGMVVTNAILEKDIAQLNIQLKNRTTTEAERLAIADQIAAKEKERAGNEIALLQEVTAAKQKEYDSQVKNKGEADDAVAQALEDAKAAEIRAAQSSIELTERVQNRVDGIREQGNAKREADAKAAQDRAKKIADDRLALEVDLVKAIQEAQGAQEKEEGGARSKKDDRVAKAYGDAELLEAIEYEYQRDITAIRAKFAAQQLTAQDALNAEIMGRQLALYTAELDALTVKQQQEVVETAMFGGDVQALLVSQAEERAALIEEIREREVQAKLEAFDAEYQAAVDAGVSTIELTAIQQEELNAIRQKYREEDAQAAQEALEQQLKQQQDAEKARLEVVTLGAETAANVSALIGAVGQQNEEASMAALALQKGASVANAIISASTARMGAIAGATANPLISAGGPAAIAAYAAPTIGLINANLAISIATILAQGLKGNFEGDPYVTGTPTLNTSRDMHVRRLHEGERVVTATDNDKYWEPLEAMREGRFDKWVSDHSDTSPRIAAYLDSENGQRDTMSVTFPHAFDRNLVETSKAGVKEMKATREEIQHLTEVVARGQRQRSTRYRGRHAA